MHGHHEYRRVWTPRIGEILLLRRQRDNVHDPFAVGVMKESTIVGHVPVSNSKCISFFLNKFGCSELIFVKLQEIKLILVQDLA